MIHSTGHKTRLDRLEKTAFFGSEAYSKEELIAEIGAATLVNHVGLETSRSFRNSAAYVQNWLQVLRNDKDDIPAIFYKHYPALIAGTMNVSELARVCGLSRPTVYKYLNIIAH